jgi:negative regulator of sigma E activity
MVKKEWAAADKRLRKIERQINTETRAIEFARRNPSDHYAARSARSAESRLIQLRRDQSSVADEKLALEREARTL